jgi:putative SOS response-associated peptidase YedK
VCGRFSFAVKARIIEERFDIEVNESNYHPRFNCAPSQNLAVISNSEPGKLNYFRWGLIPFWAKDPGTGNKMINAKAETITEKSSFRNSFRKKRCLVLSDSFYEWKRDPAKTPYRFLMNDELPFAMAGIWDVWNNPEGEELHSFSIITTISNDIVAPVHHRMPVILKQEDEKTWLNDTNEETLLSLLKPYPFHEMKCYPLSKMVNSPANDSEEIWETQK